MTLANFAVREVEATTAETVGGSRNATLDVHWISAPGVATPGK